MTITIEADDTITTVHTEYTATTLATITDDGGFFAPLIVRGANIAELEWRISFETQLREEHYTSCGHLVIWTEARA